jgi:hypothetical protein
MMETPRELLVGYMAAGIVVLVSLVLLQMLLGWILAVSLHV